MSIDFVEAIRRESTLLADVAGKLPLETPVPSCPGWTLGDLVGHLGTVQTFVATMVETRAQERLDRKTLPAAAVGPPVVPWFREATVRLVRALVTTDPSTPMWTWTRERNAGYWARRQAHEAAIHRWDAEHTAGAPGPVDAALAVDGVDELLELHLGTRSEKFVGEPCTVHLHATDAAGEWFLRLGPDGLVVEHRHAKGDVAARGKASDLDLFLWGRLGDSALEVLGNRAILERVQRLTAM